MEEETTKCCVVFKQVLESCEDWKEARDGKLVNHNIFSRVECVEIIFATCRTHYRDRDVVYF